MDKKLIAFITAVALLFTLCGTASVFALDTDTAADTEYSEAAALLSALGVNSMSNPEKNVTYNLFYDVLSSVLSQGGAALDISNLTGISFSRTAGSELLTYNDAVRSLVNLLGYKTQAESANGSYAVYASIAARIGIAKGLNGESDGSISMRNAAVMLKNALDTDMLQIKTLGTKVTYETVKGETLLYVYRGIKNDSGVVEANGYTSFFGDNGVGAKRVRINGIIYEDEKEAAQDLLGYAVDYYYEDSKTGKIVAAYKDSELNDVTLINDNFTGSEGRKIYYENENGKEKNITIPGNVPVIYNGCALSSYSNSVFDLQDKSAELIDNDSDGKIEVVYIWQGVDYFAESVDTILTKIHDSISNTLVDLSESSEYERIRIFGEDGLKTSFYTLAAGDVITAYISENGKLFDAYVTKKSVEGKITETGKNDIGESFITIGSNEYFMTNSFLSREKNNLTLGTIGTFYLNRDGKIVYADYTDGKMSYAYLMYLDDSGDDKAPIDGKILKADGNFEKFSLKEKVKIDGKNYTTLKSAKKALKDALSSCGSNVIRYDTDDNGDIYFIDTAYRSQYEGENTLFSFGEKSAATYTAGTTLFPDKFRLDAKNTVLFFAPSDANLQGEDNFGVGDPLMLKTSATHTVQGFGIDKTNFIPEVVVCDESFVRDDEITRVTGSFVFKEAKKILNDNGDETYKITYFKTYNQKEAYCSELSVFETSNVKSGDVFVGLFNNKGEFSRMLKIYDAKTGVLDLSYYEANGITTTSYSSYCYQLAGYIYFNNGTTIGVCTDDPSTITGMGEGKIKWFKISDTSGTLVDSSYKESDARYMRRIAGIEMKDYIRYGSDCARCYVRVDNNSTMLVAVYQK